MAITIRTVLASGLFLCSICFLSADAEAGNHGPPVVVAPAPAIAQVVAPVVVVPMPVGSFANVRDFPGGAVYGRAYRVMYPVLAPPPRRARRAMRRVVKYGRSDFVGPRGYAAVISPWPLIPVTTASRPFGVGVVPPGEVVAWQSPRGFFYRSNYQSAVMQSGAYPQSFGNPAEVIEVVPQGTLEVPPEPIPAPPAEF